MFSQIAHSGIELQVTKGHNGAYTITVTRKEGGTITTETITTTSTTLTRSAASYLSAPKRPRIESKFRREFESEIADLSEWFDKTEVNIELLTSEASDPQDQLTLEEQMVLVQVQDVRPSPPTCASGQSKMSRL